MRRLPSCKSSNASKLLAVADALKKQAQVGSAQLRCRNTIKHSALRLSHLGGLQAARVAEDVVHMAMISAKQRHADEEAAAAAAHTTVRGPLPYLHLCRGSIWNGAQINQWTGVSLDCIMVDLIGRTPEMLTSRP